MISTGFVQFVQVVKGLADAFQSPKVFDYAFWFLARLQVRLRGKLLRQRRIKRIWIHVVQNDVEV